MYKSYGSLAQEYGWIDGLLNGPARHIPRSPRALGAPGPEPVCEVTVNISFSTVNQTSTVSITRIMATNGHKTTKNKHKTTAKRHKVTTKRQKQLQGNTELQREKNNFKKRRTTTKRQKTTTERLRATTMRHKTTIT